MLKIREEISIILQAILIGNIIYLIYSAIRIFRRILKHNLLFISLEDLLFWIWTGLYLFWGMFQTSDGNIRWYYIAGVVFGILFDDLLAKKLKKMIDYSKKTE